MSFLTPLSQRVGLTRLLSSTRAPATALLFVSCALDGAGRFTAGGTTFPPETPWVSALSGVPDITSQPQDKTVDHFASVSFAVATSGVDMPTYRWEFRALGAANWVTISDDNLFSGATTKTLTLAHANNAVHGGGQFHCVITGPSGSVTSNAATLTVNSPVGVVNFSVGPGVSYWITADGKLWATGYGGEGQLGNGLSGFTGWSLVPLVVATSVVQVSTNGRHTAFVKADGSAWMLGQGSAGQIGDGELLSRSTPVQVAVDVVAVSTGSDYTFFLKSDGTLWQVGTIYDSFNAGANVRRTTPMQIASQVRTVDRRFFVTADDVMRGVGEDWPGTPDGVTGTGQKIVRIADDVGRLAGGGFIKRDGTLWAWGQNTLGQLGDGSYTNRASPIQVTSNVARATMSPLVSGFVKTDGTAWVTGYDSFDLVSGNTFAVPIQVGSSIERLVSDGSMSYVGHMLMLGRDGIFWVGGDNSFGQLGRGYSEFGNATPLSVWGVGDYPPLAAPSWASVVSAGHYRRLNWQAMVGASSYEVWRGTTASVGAATRIADQIDQAIFYDATAVPETGYYYWIRAVNPGRTSGYSDAVSIGVPVSVAPTITTQPEAQTVTAGSSVTFSAAASGTPAPTFQWMKNGTAITGATSASYTISATQASDAGSYSVAATNSAGSATSDAATLIVNVLPRITTQPQSQTVTAGTSVTFSVVASGTPAPTFQWMKGGTPISGATGSSFTLGTTQVSDAGDYSVVVTNSVGSGTSDAATLTVNVPPSITTQPQSQTVTAGSSVTFSVVASGTPAPTFQWMKGGTAISGATAPSFTISATQASDAGSFSVMATNSAGAVTSNVATLIVNVPKGGGGAPSGWFVLVAAVALAVRVRQHARTTASAGARTRKDHFAKGEQRTEG